MLLRAEWNVIKDATRSWGWGLFLVLLWPTLALGGGQNYYQQQYQQQYSPTQAQSQSSYQRDPSYKIPNRYGLALTYGSTVGLRDNYTYVTGTAIGLFDWARLFGGTPSRSLRLKAELTAGSRVTGEQDGHFMGSGNVLALYYLDFWANSVVRPYIEGGVGLIYTDFKVYHQGAHYNFNPVAGLGVEWFPNDYGPVVFSALRASYYSNLGLASPNQGVNSVSMQLGFLY